MAEYIKRASECTREALFVYSDHHRMIEMTESKRSEDEVLSVIADIIIAIHWNARMTEMERSGIEVLLVFADNERKFKQRF